MRGSVRASTELPLTELERRVEKSVDMVVERSVSSPRHCRICVVGYHIAGLLADGEEISGEKVEFVRFDNLSGAERVSDIPESDPRAVGVELPSRRFRGQQLSAIKRISSTVDCECPHHLSDLVTGLTGFE